MNVFTGRQVKISAGQDVLYGDLVIPRGARGIVIFAHGSGSSRMSPRNRYVASVIQQARLGTLLFDLLTVPEEAIDTQTAQYRFDISLLAGRLVQVTDWLMHEREARGLNIGYFGASTGAAAALVAAVELRDDIKAVVSRGGRPDMAESALEQVKAPALLIVGGNDNKVIELNEAALARLQSVKKLAIVAGATNLFKEPGALEQVAALAKEWFLRYLAPE